MAKLPELTGNDSNGARGTEIDVRFRAAVAGNAGGGLTAAPTSASRKPGRGLADKYTHG
jgi:hypothetical protein